MQPPIDLVRTSLRSKDYMAKKALVIKSQRKPKYKVRAYTRCRRCGRPHSVLRSSGCAVSACVSLSTPERYLASLSRAGRR